MINLPERALAARPTARQSSRRNRRLPLLLPILILLLLSPTPGFGQNTKSRVGVWNIEVLSTTARRGFPELQGDRRLPPRNADDLRKMADYIRDELEVDGLMITEIDADAPESTAHRPQSAQLNRICDHLGTEWRYFLGRTGGNMRLGFLFNSEKIRIKKLINLTASEFRVSGKDVYDRDPFIAWISFLDGDREKNDLILVCLHLKSQQRRYRNNRMAAVAKLIGDVTDRDTREALELPSAREEPEILFLGDANDSSFRNSGFRYMFDYLNGVGFRHIRNPGNYPDTRINGSQIDHIFGTEDVIENSVVPGSFTVHTVPQSERFAYRSTFSDHFPVTIDIRVRNDQDRSLREALNLTDAGSRARALERLISEPPAPGGPEALPDDRDDEPIRVDAEIIGGNIERILGPFRPSGRRTPGGAPGTGPAAAKVAAPRSAKPTAAMPDRKANKEALALALELIQKEIREAAVGQSPNLKRIERLAESEKRVVRLLLQRP